MNRQDIYRLLGISERASAELVKKAFRDFAKNNHPDFFPGDSIREERFKIVTSAYQTWKLIHTALKEITRLRAASQYMQYSSSGFRPWTFSCKA